jgi:large subunit ribosomal protein L30
MAEQSSRDVVDQTLSGGEPSPSDVPASTNDNLSAGGDAGKTEHIAMNSATSNNSHLSDQQNHETTDMLDSRRERTGSDKETVSSATVSYTVAKDTQRVLTCAQDNSKQGAGLVATRVLELNGIASASDGGDDTASQGGSESDASRTDSRNHARSGSVKKPGSFKPVSFAKFSVPKVAGAPTPPKVPEKGMFFVKDLLMTSTDLCSAFRFNYTTRYPAAELSTTTCRKDHRRDARFVFKDWSRRSQQWWIGA